MIRYAIPMANGQLCMHFGHAAQFAILDYDEDTKSIVKNEIHTPPPHEPGVLPAWLHEHGVNIIIAGGMGQRAVMLFEQKNITVVIGATGGTAEEVVLAHATHELITGENICDH
jgi:ATP-binding protein involved in chromosome partitioning